MATGSHAAQFMSQNERVHEAIVGIGANARRCIVRWMQRHCRIEFYRREPGFGWVVRAVAYEDRAPDAVAVGASMLAERGSNHV